MQYFKKINLNCAELIKEFAIADTIMQVQDKKYIFQLQIKHSLPSELKNIINAELHSYGIPEVLYCQTYLRHPNHVQGIHIDGDSQLISCAINIPLKGCANSKYNWYDGDYKLNRTDKNGLIFHDIKWTNKPIMAATVNLNDTYLIRVDAPHSAVAGPEERWIFTMRFHGNPPFDELYDKL